MVIFIVGGTTYEESRSVALQNASNSGIRFILGGSVVLNSKRYAQVIIIIIFSELASDRWENGLIIYLRTTLHSCYHLKST